MWEMLLKSSLSRSLTTEYACSFEAKNLRRMIQFAETFPDVLDFFGMKDRYIRKDLEDAILREIVKKAY